MTEPPVRTPPKYVPTLTQVMPAQAAQAIAAAQAAQAMHQGLPAKELSPEQMMQLADHLRQQLTMQVRQQLNSQLDRRVREAVSGLALQHAQHMLETMHPLIEDTVARAIDDAMGEALGQILAKQLGSPTG
jgi:uncharacterized protein YbcC (UPF0753/DUF2309 family)